MPGIGIACLRHPFFTDGKQSCYRGSVFPPSGTLSSLNSQQAGWVKQITGAGARKSSRARLPPLFEPAVPVELLKERRPDAHTASRLTAHSVKCFQLFTL
jgi:hypothetical protein